MSRTHSVLSREFSLSAFASLTALGLVALFFTPAGARTNDPWNDKDPAAWTQKDVQKILNDSPWSKQLRFGIAPDGALSQNMSSLGSSGLSETSGTQSGAINPSYVPPPNNGPTGASPDFVSMAKFTVRWNSSRTVREALLREKELSNESPTDAAKISGTSYESYQISISGTDLRAFVKAGAVSLKAHSYILTKNTKQMIPPSNIIVQGTESGSIVAVMFEFSRKTAAGEPTIAPNEKSLEFYCKVGALPLKVTFDVSKMSDKDGRDL